MPDIKPEDRLPHELTILVYRDLTFLKKYQAGQHDPGVVIEHYIPRVMLHLTWFKKKVFGKEPSQLREKYLNKVS